MLDNVVYLALSEDECRTSGQVGGTVKTETQRTASDPGIVFFSGNEKTLGVDLNRDGEIEDGTVHIQLHTFAAGSATTTPSASTLSFEGNLMLGAAPDAADATASNLVGKLVRLVRGIDQDNLPCVVARSPF